MSEDRSQGQRQDQSEEDGLAASEAAPGDGARTLEDVDGGTDGLQGERLEGIVTALAPGLFVVAAGGQSYLCTLRGRLRKPRPLPPTGGRRPGAPAPTRQTRGSTKTPGAPAVPAQREQSRGQSPARIAPGDRVMITPLSATEGVIEEVLPRHTVLARARGEHASEHVMLANPDLAVLVFATREPEPHFGLLDRYLALCEQAGVHAVICMNKDDLGVPGDVGALAEEYATLGYPVLYTSAATSDGLDRLSALLQGKVSLLTGESGVGKSSLTNLLVPDAAQRIGEISRVTGLGRHTTTGVRLLPLPAGGWLADSAGIRELSLWNVPSEELASCFVELRPFIGECLYEDCTHSENEEGCALRAALEQGAISPRRWASFERLLTEARAEEQPAWSSR